MRFIELTDGNDQSQKEYLDADDVSRVEAYRHERDLYEVRTVRVGLFKSQCLTQNVKVGTQTLSGSLVYMKSPGGQKTFVAETPAQVYALLQGNK